MAKENITRDGGTGRMRILIAGEKYVERYFAVETDKELHQASVKLLKERLDNGWYGGDTNKYLSKIKGKLAKAKEFMDLVKDVEAPDEALVSCKKSISGYENEISNLEDELEFENEVKEAIETDYDSIPQDHEMDSVNERYRQFAWSLLQQRSDYEYERVELQNTEEL